MPAETTDISVAVEQVDPCTRKLSVTVPAPRVQRARQQVMQQLASRVRMPGFRKGKLPAKLIEQRYAGSVEQETVDRLIQEAYREALNTEGLVPLSQGRVENVEYDAGSELRFEAEIEVRPELELARTSGFTVSRPAETVEEGDVDNVLERLRSERGTWEPLEEGTPDYGDRVTVQITALDEQGQMAAGEEPRSYRVVIGEGQAIPAVEEAILTLPMGEEDTFEVTFPEDFPDEERRGETQRLHIKAVSGERKRLPELDDAFAESLGEFESLAALRERVRKDLQEDAEQRAEAEVHRQLIDQVIEANEVPVPDSMVERYLDQMMGRGQDQQQEQPSSPEEEEQIAKLREGVRPQAEWGIRRMLIVEHLAEAEGLTATQDEIDARVEQLAEQHERSPSEVWIQLEKSGQLEMLEREITENKVFEHLISQNTVA